MPATSIEKHGGVKLTMKHLEAMKNKLTHFKDKAEKVKEKANHAVAAGLDSLLISGTAFAAGMLQGRTGGVFLPGDVSLELGLGVAGLGLSMFGVGGAPVKSISDGLLATHFATVGRSRGHNMLDKTNQERTRQGLPPLKDNGVHLLGGGKTSASEAPKRPTATVKETAAGRLRR